MLSLRSILKTFYLCVLSLLLLSPAYGQDTTAQESLDPAKVESLVSTLKDDQARADFVATLETLVQASEATEEKNKTAEQTAQMLKFKASLEEKLTAFTDTAQQAYLDLDQLPAFTQKIIGTDTSATAFSALFQFILIIGLAWGAGYVAKFLLRGLYRYLAPEKQLGLFSKLFYLSLRLVVDLLPIAAIALVGYGLLGLIDVLPLIGLFIVAMLTATLSGCLVCMGLRFTLSPFAPSLRLPTLSDDIALYCYSWTRFFVHLGFMVTFLAMTALENGLSSAIYTITLSLLALIIGIFAFIAVARKRRTITEMIKGGQSSPVRTALAGAWSILAFGYIALMTIFFMFGLETGYMILIQLTAATIISVILANIISNAVGTFLQKKTEKYGSLTYEGPAPLKQRMIKYIPYLKTLLSVFIWVGSIYFVITAWNFEALKDVSATIISFILSLSSSVLITVFLAILAWEGFNYALEKHFYNQGTPKKSQRLDTILPLVQKVMLIIIVIITGLTILSELGVNIAPLLAGASVFGVAIGFGSQTLVKDIITGLFMLVEDTMSVGDLVDIGGGHVGTVEALAIRTVRLRDASGTVHTVPFSSISTVKNLTRIFSFHVFTMGVAYEENVDHVIETIKEIGQELRQSEAYKADILDELEVLGLDTFGDSSVNIKGRIKTKPGSQFKVGRELNRLMKNTFDRKGISIPFPCRTVYLQKDDAAETA